MKSTGEVMGIDYDFGLAFYKACYLADNELPLKGNIFISVNIEQKEEAIPIARQLRDLGLILYGTGDVNLLLYKAGKARIRKKVQEGSPNVLDMMRHGEIRLIINTPQDKQYGRTTTRSCVRQWTLASPIPTLQAARAAALLVIKQKVTLEPLSHYLKGTM